MADCDSKFKGCIRKLINLKLENDGLEMKKVYSRMMSANLSATDGNRETGRIVRRRKQSKIAKKVDLSILMQELSLTAETTNLLIQDVSKSFASPSMRKSNILKDSNPENYLLIAIKQMNLRLVSFFIKQGANVNCCASSGYTPLTKTLSITHWNKTARQIIVLLLDAGAKPFQKDNGNRYPLIEAVKMGELKLVEKMVGSEPEIGAVDQRVINLALYMALLRHDLPIFKFLVENGADISSKDNSLSLLGYAIGNQKCCVVKFLLREKYFIDDVRQNIQKYCTIALRQRALGTLDELEKVAKDFGTPFPEMPDDMTALCERFQNVVGASFQV